MKLGTDFKNVMTRLIILLRGKRTIDLAVRPVKGTKFFY